ncbi:GntR family transcriptional regulator [Streptomyces sp. McG3]|uniref:GntR family transcriptional regulator n=1 Tax=unclassified Streptomyces TaxID=2593676 RepID=UPI001BEC3823|nr:GntR family transcriptional regulator [Streptomyces sp. McG3]MBT2895543.1 GntR family transcriptional regulator [Streptomyces sp. McG3]
MEQGSAHESARPAYALGAFPRTPAEGRMPECRVPEQARGERAGFGQPGFERPGGRPGEGEQAARGEHTHGEPPAPRAVVQRHSVRGQILDALRAALVDGELVPGQVYSAPALGARFGVSATPVREAMQRLAVEGAVEVVPNRGFRVSERGPRELAELAEVRALIEVPVMLSLARTVPAHRWSGLRPLAEATVTAAAVGDRAAYAESDRAFHRAVLMLSGNEQLVTVADELHRRSQWPLVSGPATRRADLLADASEHTALLDALVSQDLAVVQALVREHFAGADG